MGMSVAERGGFKCLFRPSSFFWFQVNGATEQNRAVFLCTFHRYESCCESVKSLQQLYIGGLFRFCLYFGSICFSWRAEVEKWKRLTESGLTAGVSPENGGCYREGMQRFWRTFPNCYRRHEGRPEEIYNTSNVIWEPLSDVRKLSLPVTSQTSV